MQIELCLNRHVSWSPMLHDRRMVDLDAVHLYSENFLEPGVNHIDTLEASGWLRYLRDHRIKLAVWMSAMNEHGRAADFADELKRIHDRLGGQMFAVLVDEPVFKMRHYAKLSWSPERTADEAKPFYQMARRLGLRVWHTEPFPAVSAFDTLRYVNRLDGFIDRLVADINWYAVDREQPKKRWWEYLIGGYGSRLRLYTARIASDLSALQAWGPFAVIVGSPIIPTHGLTGSGFVASADEQLSRMYASLRHPPDVVIVQSWEPHDLTYPSSETMAAVVDDVIGARAA